MTSAKASGMAEKGKQTFEVEKLSRRETLELVRAYYKIMDPAVRKKIFEMVKAVGNSALGSDTNKK
jgi:hypothetical protein